MSIGIIAKALDRAALVTPRTDEIGHRAEARIILAQSLCERAAIHGGPGEVFAIGNARIEPIVGAIGYAPGSNRWVQIRTFGHLPFGWVSISGLGIEPLTINVATPDGERRAVAKLREITRPRRCDAGWRRVLWDIVDALKHA